MGKRPMISVENRKFRIGEETGSYGQLLKAKSLVRAGQERLGHACYGLGVEDERLILAGGHVSGQKAKGNDSD